MATAAATAWKGPERRRSRGLLGSVVLQRLALRPPQDSGCRGNGLPQGVSLRRRQGDGVWDLGPVWGQECDW